MSYNDLKLEKDEIFILDDSSIIPPELPTKNKDKKQKRLRITNLIKTLGTVRG